MLQRLLWGGLVAVATATMPTFTALAEPLPIMRTLSLGRPPKPVRIGLVSGALLTLSRDGKRQTLPAERAQDVSLESVPLGTDAAVAIVRVTAANGRWVGLIGGRSGSELLMFEPADMRGDPGERHQHDVQAIDGAVRTGLRFDDVSLCGGRPVWLEPRAIDPRTLALQPSRMPPPRVTLTDAKIEQASPRSTPMLSALVAVASSTRSPDTQLPRAPRGLLEAEGSGFEAGAGSFAQLRWEGGALPIEELSLEVTSAAPQSLTLWWLSEAPTALRTDIAATAGRTAIRIVPPSPIAGRCLALYVVAQTGAEPPTLRALRAHTALDRPGGVDVLISQLVRDDAEAGHAASLLSRLGPEIAVRVATRWDALSTRGKRRALTAVAPSLARDEVRRRVVESADAPEPELRDAALATLTRGKEAGRRGLAELAARHTPAGDAAARALADAPDGATPLLAALSRPGAASRRVLHEALATSARRDPARFAAASEGWLAGAPGVAARAALALSAARGGASELASRITEQSAPEAGSFEERYRFALTLHDAALGPRATAWLEREAQEAPEWMQRRAAFEALARHAVPRLSAIAGELVHDPYPRVRASALPVLAVGSGAEAVAQLAVDDAWPLVRVAALHALAISGQHGEVVARSLEDPAPSVRQAAIEALAASERRQLWPSIARMLLSEREAESVRLAAVGFARELCVQDAREPLLQTARSLLSADAGGTRGAVALEALRALRALGGEAERAGAALVSESGAPPLAALWARLPPPRCATATDASAHTQS